MNGNFLHINYSYVNIQTYVHHGTIVREPTAAVNQDVFAYTCSQRLSGFYCTFLIRRIAETTSLPSSPRRTPASPGPHLPGTAPRIHIRRAAPQPPPPDRAAPASAAHGIPDPKNQQKTQPHAGPLEPTRPLPRPRHSAGRQPMCSDQLTCLPLPRLAAATLPPPS